MKLGGECGKLANLQKKMQEQKTQAKQKTGKKK